MKHSLPLFLTMDAQSSKGFSEVLSYFSGTCPRQVRSVSAIEHSQLHIPVNTGNFGSCFLPQVILEIT